MEQLGSYLVDLLSLESAKLVDTTQLVLDDIHAEHARLHEVEKDIAEQGRHLDETRASYQGL